MFSREIESKCINFQKVKNRYKSNEQLATLDPRKIYDKIRQECQRKTKIDEPLLPSLKMAVNSCTDVRDISRSDCQNETTATEVDNDRNPSTSRVNSGPENVLNRTADEESDNSDSDVLCPSTKSSKLMFSQSRNNSTFVQRHHCLWTNIAALNCSGA